MTRRRRLAPALAALLLVASCGDPPTPARVPDRPPTTFVGLSAEDTLVAPPGTRARELRAQRRAGVGVIRQVFDWARVEVEPGRYETRRREIIVPGYWKRIGDDPVPLPVPR